MYGKSYAYNLTIACGKTESVKTAQWLAGFQSAIFETARIKRE